MGMEMDERTATIGELLHEAGETHHTVYRITDGADDDWASFYADWLIRLSELKDVLGTTPVPSELIYVLVEAERDYGKEKPDETWEEYYARRIVEHLAPS